MFLIIVMRFVLFNGFAYPTVYDSQEPIWSTHNGNVHHANLCGGAIHAGFEPVGTIRGPGIS